MNTQPFKKVLNLLHADTKQLLDKKSWQLAMELKKGRKRFIFI